MGENRRERHYVTSTAELQSDGSRVIVEIDGQEIAVFRYDGEYHAVANYCVHQAGPLCEGALEGRWNLDEDGWGWNYEDDGKYVVCPWHGWMFDITTGVNTHDDDYAVPTYDTEIDDGDIYILR